MAKIYSANTWEDEALANDPRFDILEDDDTPFKSDMQIALSTDVVQAGTAVDADKMNNIEDGIDALDTIVADRILSITTGGTSTAFTLTTIGESALTTNERFRVQFHTTAGATPTLERDSKGAKSLKYYDSTGAKVACGATSIVADMISDVEYDGTDYVVLDALPNLASSAEINTGTDATKLITPDALAGSNLGIRIVQLMCFAPTEDLAVGDTEGTGYFVVPAELNGYRLVGQTMRVITPGVTGSSTMSILNDTDSQEMLLSAATIETGEYSTLTSAQPGTVDTNHNDLATDDLLKVNVDGVSSVVPKGLIAVLKLQLP
jgi:hypothetical protein